LPRWESGASESFLCDRVEKGVRSLCGRTRGEEVRSHLVEFDNDGRSLLYFVEGDRFLVAMEMKGDRGVKQ
jgi:1-acyl-sn-glycerol-3-phosphate acyltransferase